MVFVGGHLRRGLALRLVLCGRGPAFVATRASTETPPLSGLAHALCLAGVCRGAAVDAQEGGSVGKDGGSRRTAAHGRLVRHQLPLRVDVLGNGLERGEMAGVRGLAEGWMPRRTRTPDWDVEGGGALLLK